MITIPLPHKIPDYLNLSCDFDGDTFYITGKNYNLPIDELQECDFYKVTTSGIEHNCIEQAGGFEMWDYKGKPIYRNACHDKFGYIENGKFVTKKINRKLLDRHWNFAVRKNDYLVFYGRSNAIEKRITRLFISKFLQEILEKNKKNELVIYNFNTNSAKVFKLPSIPKACSIGDNLAAAVTNKHVYFFDLD